MTAQIEQIIYGRMNSQESLSLMFRFEPAHAPLSYPRWLMRKFSTVIGILRCVMNRIRDKFSMGSHVASQLVRHYFPRLTMMVLKQTFEKALRCLAVPP
jgi:hypothetical protein